MQGAERNGVHSVEQSFRVSQNYVNEQLLVVVAEAPQLSFVLPSFASECLLQVVHFLSQRAHFGLQRSKGAQLSLQAPDLFVVPDVYG